MDRFTSEAINTVINEKKSKLSDKEQLEKDRVDYQKFLEKKEKTYKMKHRNIHSESAPVAPVASKMRTPNEIKILGAVKRERQVMVYDKFNFRLPDNLSKAKRLTMAREMLAYIAQKISENELVLLDDFPLSKKWHPRKFYNLADRDDDFKDALDIAKIFVSNQLQKGGLKRDFDSGLTSKLLPYYDSQYKEFLKEMTKDFQPSQTTQRVIVEEVRNCSEVPERKKDE